MPLQSIPAISEGIAPASPRNVSQTPTSVTNFPNPRKFSAGKFSCTLVTGPITRPRRHYMIKSNKTITADVVAVTGCSREQAELALDVVFETMKVALASDEYVHFGSLFKMYCTRPHNHVGRNPKNSSVPIKTYIHRTIQFKPSLSFIRSLNSWMVKPPPYVRLGPDEPRKPLVHMRKGGFPTEKGARKD